MFNTGQRTVDWHYPSRLDCMTCHVPTGGSTLGPETAQMNRAVSGTGPATNQIARLAALNLFDAPVPTPYKTALVVPYTSQAGSPPASATVEQRARSYLQANCAFCHRPDDYVFPNFDLRDGVALKDMNICDVVPAKGDQGVPGANDLEPGQADELDDVAAHERPARGRQRQVRPHAEGRELRRRPDRALDLIAAWITSITACPHVSAPAASSCRAGREGS